MRRFSIFYLLSLLLYVCSCAPLEEEQATKLNSSAEVKQGLSKEHGFSASSEKPLEPNLENQENQAVLKTTGKADWHIIDKKSINQLKNTKSLSGTGRALFTWPVFGLRSKELYFIDVMLFNEHSFLILHSHFTGFHKQDGIRVFFIRENNRLIIKAGSPSYPVQNLTAIEQYFSKNQQLKLYVEIHNGSTNFIDIQIWDAYINLSGYLKKPAEFLSIENLIANTNNTLFYSRGKGLLWGVELNKARLTLAQRKSINQ